MFVEQWQLHTLTFHFMLYWMGLSVFFSLPWLVKKLLLLPPLGSQPPPPPRRTVQVPSSRQCRTKGWGRVWDSSPLTNRGTKHVLWGRFSTHFYHLHSSWATALGAVRGSASLHVNKLGNLASEGKERPAGLQPVFPSRLNFIGMLLMCLHSTAAPSQGNAQEAYSPGLNISPGKTRLTLHALTIHAHTTFPGISPSGWLPLTAAAWQSGALKQKIATESGPDFIFSHDCAS